MGVATIPNWYYILKIIINLINFIYIILNYKSFKGFLCN